MKKIFMKVSEIGKVFLLYVKNTTDRTGRLLLKHNIETIYKPTKTIGQCFWSTKDRKDPFSTTGAYRN